MQNTHQTTRLLFVCLGNICRSPLAEGIARRIVERNGLAVEVDSAGTGSWHVGEPPCAASITVARRNGIDIGMLCARQVTPFDRNRFTHIVALDRANKRDLEAMGFSQVYLLGDFGGFGGEDVPDPYYFKGMEGFERVYAMIERAVTDLITKVTRESD